MKIFLLLPLFAFVFLGSANPQYAESVTFECNPNQTHNFTETEHEFGFTCENPNPPIPVNAIILSGTATYGFSPSNNQQTAQLSDGICTYAPPNGDQTKSFNLNCDYNATSLTDISGYYRANLFAADNQDHFFMAPTISINYELPSSVSPNIDIDSFEFTYDGYVDIYLTESLPILENSNGYTCDIYNSSNDQLVAKGGMLNTSNTNIPNINRCQFGENPNIPAGNYYIFIAKYNSDSTGKTIIGKSDNFSLSERPIISPYFGASIFEGDTYEETIYFSDPDSSSWTARVDYGEGAGFEPITIVDNTIELSHTYHSFGDSGTFSVQIAITDNENSTNYRNWEGSQATVSVHVENPIQLSLENVTYNDPDTGGAGDCPEVNNYQFHAPCNNATFKTLPLLTFPSSGLECSVESDDTFFYSTRVNSLNDLNNCKAFSEEIATETNQLVRVLYRNILNDIVAQTEPVDFNFPEGSYITPPLNVSPEIFPLNGAHIDPGFSYSEAGYFEDDTAYPWSATVNYGDGGGEEPLLLNAYSFSLDHQYDNPGTYTVTVKVKDNKNQSDEATATIVVGVTNEVPVIQTLSGSTIEEEQIYSESGSFTDVDSSSWTGTVNYGEGNGDEPLTLDGFNFELSHQYNTPGEYEVTVKITDEVLATGSSTATVIVVEPNSEPVTILPIADTFIKQGGQNENEGGSSIMRLQSSGKNRGLVQFSQEEIEEAIGSSESYTATLRFVITDNGNNWGNTGRTIALHRLLDPWIEGNGFIVGNQPTFRGDSAGATWNCGIDDNTANQTNDCSSTWEMTNSSSWPFITSSSASTLITNNQEGVVEIDVTGDIQEFMNGTDNFGWVIKKTEEGANGRVEFGSRESENPPTLIISFN